MGSLLASRSCKVRTTKVSLDCAKRRSAVAPDCRPKRLAAVEIEFDQNLEPVALPDARRR